ncbi:hypothetical protein ThrDRAFT_03157 [Frankia casuarinae]|uniref:hypothetical protein n=1 Tax=Frankia TaxID=1854 RepID=UPI000053B538|nr:MULTISPECIES: hypothetical protein [Frankia]ETA00822.1 hypothetical protein CcI6DRAFT_03763 [Frankia sp. CcI6]EYT91230.1 hypothetical protein ThrDRAFT_03157 [Frankia casuarinae]KFB03376.1 hypothetical protein ALLO2DRAFT_03880 [Frankia sp. Allo2]OAA21482.1 hypothetical protein AAY23_107621 [Frankia casuarinae]
MNARRRWQIVDLDDGERWEEMDPAVRRAVDEAGQTGWGLVYVSVGLGVAFLLSMIVCR